MADHDFSEDDLIQLQFLRDEEIDALVDAAFLGPDARLSTPLESTLSFPFYPELTLTVTPGQHYPILPLEHVVINHSLPRTEVDDLRARLRAILQEAEVTNSLDKWLSRENDNVWGVFEREQVVFKMVNETERTVERFRAATRVPGKEYLPFATKKPVSATLSNSEMAFQYLGKTTQEICNSIPSDLRVLHIESVIRPDLASKFDRQQDRLRNKLLELSYAELRNVVPLKLSRSRGPTTEEMVEHLVEPHITFHGTQRHLVPSIVRYGFMKPGTKRPDTGEEHGVRCGSTYGQGIYSSPSALFALSYSNYDCGRTKPDEFFGLKLIVCATIMGRARLMYREDNWRTEDEVFDGADSHVGNRNLEYIVFEPSQIIPVYVVHLDWGEDNALHFASIPSNASSWIPVQSTKLHPKLAGGAVFAGDKKRAKEAALAKASKYFPYGYGPATGGRFVVEEVGEVSEDEEEYGTYQAMRVEESEDKSASLNFWSWVKAADEEEHMEANESVRANEYTHAKGFRPLHVNWDEIPVPGKEPAPIMDDDEDFGLVALNLEEP